MIGAQPFERGSVHVTVADRSPPTADTRRGLSGTVAGTTDALADAGEAPTRFMAVTTTEYVTPFVSPDTRHESGFESTPTIVEHDAPLGDTVTV